MTQNDWNGWPFERGFNERVVVLDPPESEHVKAPINESDLYKALGTYAAWAVILGVMAFALWRAWTEAGAR